METYCSTKQRGLTKEPSHCKYRKISLVKSQNRPKIANFTTEFRKYVVFLQRKLLWNNKKMKNMKKILSIVAIAMCVLATSCNKNKDREVVQATATGKILEKGGIFFEVDADYAVVPTNLSTLPFEPGQTEMRVMLLYTENNVAAEPVPGYAKTKSVEVIDWAKTLTKDPIVYDPAKTYTNDPVGLYLDNVFPSTMIEDGYLSVSFVMPVSGFGGQHIVNLLTGVDPTDPYTVAFVHDAQGDLGPGRMNGLVCFPLRSLPDTEGKTVKLTLKWQSVVTGKEESVQFDYCSRTDWVSLYK